MKVWRREIPPPSPQRLAALVQAEAPSCWLDSALESHPHSGESWVVLRPWQVRRAQRSEQVPELLWELDQWLEGVRGQIAGEARGSGGAFGFLSYPSLGSNTPAAWWLLADTGIFIDHRAARAWIYSLGWNAQGQAEADLAERKIAELAQCLATTPELGPRPLRVHSLKVQDSRETYLAKLRDVQERIRRGDCYQVNLSQRFHLQGEWEAADLYLRLREHSPAPQMAFLNLGETQILSASPEILLQTEGRRARSYPIKGTRPRGANPAADRELAAALLHSPKDAAELLMILDLVRNDLGSCSETGSVQVPERRRLDSLPQVHHLYAIVESRLRTGVGPFQALSHLFPGGSITGAPKLKAMEIIAALEGRPREIYTGSIGYAGFDGRACFNIAIRTACLQGTDLYYSAGGGIVADSIPEAEYEECLDKTRGFFQALGIQQKLLIFFAAR